MVLCLTRFTEGMAQAITNKSEKKASSDLMDLLGLGDVRLFDPDKRWRHRKGREYLRIIYGPDYTSPENLTRLRNRNLGRKRSLALREYALGLESVSRLVAGEPLWRIHEAVFAVLALESEPVDPRL